ncbi:MAG: hypothetical protein Q9187_000345 [Circinaria calcarea]
MSLPRPDRHRSASRLSRFLHQSQSPTLDDSGDHGELSGTPSTQVEIRSYAGLRPRAESSHLAGSFSSSSNQKTPARSYFQRPFLPSPGPADTSQHASQTIREDTAELASWALSDAASVRSGTPPRCYNTSALNNTLNNRDTDLDIPSDQDLPTIDTVSLDRPDVIQEVSEPVSPESKPSSRKSPSTSILTELFRNATPAEEEITDEEDLHSTPDDADVQTVTVRNGILSQPHERTSLLNGKTCLDSSDLSPYRLHRDIESLEGIRPGLMTTFRYSISRPNEYAVTLGRRVMSPKTWGLKAVWRMGIIKPAGYIPAVILGLLLNILDALSYGKAADSKGMILFPLGQPIFASLGPDGISMFYVSCIVSQLTYSLGGSIFKGGVGSEMIEVVPFFHKMAFTILARVGEDKPDSVRATTILAYSASSVLTGAVFYLMGRYFGDVDWGALGTTIPAMLALTFFGILHVPINIPALGLSTGEDNVDVDRELRGHGLSNALSGLCGSIQNYLVYTNTVLFIRSGGDSRVAGCLLALGTFGILVVGARIIGFIPITVVATLIYFLAIDLLTEALVHTWGRLHRLEYLTIVIIVVTMGAWDFVIGIFVGIVLACVNLVLQTSRISAIRGTLPGGIASSTVRRHPVQHRFLQEVGRQIHVMKLAGYLFFGTIVGVESRVRTLLLNEAFEPEPFQFLVLDLSKVDGVDFSAAEAFARINRILSKRNVIMIMCGITPGSEVGRSLDNVGLSNKENGIEFFEDLNSALEYCENELLKAFYRSRDALTEGTLSKYLAVPERNTSLFSSETMFSSPRRNQLEAVAAVALKEHHDSVPHTKWQEYSQPLQLVLQTFSNVSDKNEEFWSRAASFFERKYFATGTVLYSRGERPDGFYLLESGILKAEYALPQGKFSELILAGTTCGELPFFSGTCRTSTTSAERECTTWMLNEERWETLQRTQPDIAQELLKIGLKLTTERMDAITKYMLLTSG